MLTFHRVVAGGLGAEEEYEWSASIFVECEGVLGGQFPMVVKNEVGEATWCKWLFVSNKLLIVHFKAGYLAPDCPWSTNSSATGCL